jgi:hypothetical protein
MHGGDGKNAASAATVPHYRPPRLGSNFTDAAKASLSLNTITAKRCRNHNKF